MTGNPACPGPPRAGSTRIACALAWAFIVSAAQAETPVDFLTQFTAEAKAENASFAGFDPARGEQWFKEVREGKWSCASCHTEDPRQPGRHKLTDKLIKPLAPAVEATRFTDTRKVAKWFRRNCNDVLKRACTAQEKGDVLSYLIGLKP